jgi:hypothetical protein
MRMLAAENHRLFFRVQIRNPDFLSTTIRARGDDRGFVKDAMLKNRGFSRV